MQTTNMFWATKALNGPCGIVSTNEHVYVTNDNGTISRISLENPNICVSHWFGNIQSF